MSKVNIDDVDGNELDPVPAKGKGTKKKPTLTELRERSETLDLLEEKPKAKRGAAATAADVGMSTIGARPKTPPVAPAKPGAPAEAEPENRPSKLDEQKQNALSLFDPEAMKAERAREREERRRKAEEAKALPAISRLIQEKDERVEAEKAALTAILQKSAAPADPAETAPVVEAVAETAEEAADSKIIHIKPPIIVRELAERMGLKGFQAGGRSHGHGHFREPESGHRAGCGSEDRRETWFHL